MKKELEDFISKFSDCSEMFDKADKQIRIAKLEMENKVAQEQNTKRKNEKAKTEDFAYSILSLINDTLATANEKKGSIESVEKYKNLGRLTTQGISGTEFSHYCVNDDGLTISLNYSTEGYDTVTWGGYLDGSNINWEYLNEILSPMNINARRNQSSFQTCGSSGIKDILTITLKRPKKLDSENKEMGLNNPNNCVEEYGSYEKKLIFLIKQVFPGSFNWETEVPFKRNCTVQELSLIENGLKSGDVRQRTEALFGFMDLERYFEQEVHKIELDIKEKMRGYFNPNFSDEFKKSLEEEIHKTAYEEFMEQMKPSFEIAENFRRKS